MKSDYKMRTWKIAGILLALQLSAGVVMAQAPANDECSGAIPIMGTGAMITGNNTNATESMPANCGIPSAAKDVWFSFTPSTTGTVTINIDQTTVYSAYEAFSGTCSNLTSLGCESLGAPLNVSATQGTTYYLRVYNYIDNFFDVGTFNIIFSGASLPITGGKLTGTVKNNKAQLAWSTFSEQNNKGFMVQRSENGNVFRNIGWAESKAPKGNSTSTLNYTFTDPEAITGTIYYRLQQTDIDGKTTWSNILRLTPGNEASFTVVAAPNPVSDKLQLTTFGTPGTNAAATVTDITGKRVKSMPVTGTETEIDMSNLSSGMYFIRYQDDNHTQTIKVSKQ